MLVTGRSLAKRFLRVLFSIELFLISFGAARRNNSYVVSLYFNVDHEQQLSAAIESDNGVSRLVISRGIRHNKQRIEERSGRIFETNTMFASVGGRFRGIPHEIISANAVAHVH